MASSLKTRALAGAFFAFVTLASISALGWRSTMVLVEANRSVSRTHQISALIDDIRSLTRQAEVRTEGLPGGNVAGIDEIAVTLNASVAALGELLSDDRSQQGRFRELSAVLKSLERDAADASKVHVAADRARAVVDMMADFENRSLIAQLKTTQLSAGAVTRALSVLTLAGGGLLAIAFFVIYRQTQRQMRLDRMRIDTEAQMHVVIDRMLAGLITTDMRGRVETANPAAEKMFGYSAKELSGESITRLMAVTGDDARAILKDMPGPALGRVTEWDAKRKDGTVFPVELALFSFEAGGSGHLAGHLHDISERREIDRMKTEFVSVVSHELRTPLTSIRGALQLVQDDPPVFKDEEHAPLLDIALSNTERLIRLVNDILDVSKIEAGQVQLRRKACDVGDLVHVSIDAVAEFARASAVRIVVECDETLTVNADPDRLVQILTNLLSNAVKFSDERSTVNVQVRSTGTFAEIAVRDRGQGIPDSELSQLFRKFRQLDSSATRNRGGTGLGLAIVKALIEQHGGTITVKSQPGQGSTFTVTVPLAVSATSQRPVAAVEPVQARSMRGTVILAEDDDDLREVMAQTLSRRGFRVLSAPNGDVARSLYETTPCDALVVDLHMPIADGFDLIAYVRQGQRGQTIPILVVSGSNSGSGETRSMSLGANVFFTKPVNPDQLVADLNRLMRAETPPA